jgi:hypothetical protein
MLNDIFCPKCTMYKAADHIHLRSYSRQEENKEFVHADTFNVGPHALFAVPKIRDVAKDYSISVHIITIQLKIFFFYPEDGGSTFLRYVGKFYHTTRCNIPEYTILNCYLRENLNLTQCKFWQSPAEDVWTTRFTDVSKKWSRKNGVQLRENKNIFMPYDPLNNAAISITLT